MKSLIFIFLLFVAAFGRENPRVIALDWTCAEILEFLGYQTLAVGEKKSYEIWTGEQGDKTLDLGLRNQPNLEMIIQLKPDLVILPELFSHYKKTISNYAKTEIIDVYKSGNLEQNLNEAVLKIGKILGDEQNAKAKLAKNEEFFAQKRAKFTEFDSQILVVQFSNEAHLRIYGQNSLYGLVLDKLGLKNAAPQNLTYNLWGIANAPISALFGVSESTKLIIIEPNRVDIDLQIKTNGIYKNIKILQNRAQIRPVWSAGAVLSMQKFANLLSEILLNENSKSDKK